MAESSFQTAAKVTHASGLSAPAVSHVEWGEAAALVEWFLASEPPAEAFVMVWNDRGTLPAITITDPAAFWRDLRTDIAGGAGLGRDHVGAVRSDLRRLHGLFGGGAATP